jgi:hypothetical protein
MTIDNEFDALLHDALSEYRDAEPLAGLEDRVLERLAEVNDKRKAPWLRWAVAAACAAVVAIAVWIGASRRSIETQAPTAVVTVRPAESAPAQAPAPVVRAPAVTAHKATKSVRTAIPSAPAAGAQAKPAVFPLPTPLTGDERALMAVLQQDPKAATGASEESKPITIAEIEIKPLAIGGLSSSENPGEKQ